MKQRIEFAEQSNQMIRVDYAVKFAHSLYADTAAFWKLTVFGDEVVDTWNENELQPLTKSHCVHCKGLREVVLLSLQGFGLPETDVLQLDFDLVNLSLYG